MPDIYDSEARRMVLKSKLPGHYDELKCHFLGLAKSLYRILYPQSKPGRRPLPGDLQALLGEALLTDQDFIDKLPDLSIDARRTNRRIASAFAGYIVDKDWDAITKEDDGESTGQSENEGSG